MSEDHHYRFRNPLNTPEIRGARARVYSKEEIDEMIIERDVQVPTRFGYSLYADIYRPINESTLAPAIIAWTPYGKHNPAPIGKIYPDSGVKEEWISDYTIFEAPDPVYWVPQGYAVITIDIPGVWYAQSPATYMSPEEAEAFYDAIEWAGESPWSNGKVGLSGVSYLTVMQWRVAQLNPPHLAAINPWEGWTDTYREVIRHGGIPETCFWPYIQVRWGASDHMIEDLWAETIEHPLFDDFWVSKAAYPEDIQVPAFVVSSWSDHGMHTRGTLEGFRRLGSSEKWLLVHGRKKWAHYYDPENVALQLTFFDYYLKGIGPGITWPKVQVEIRDDNQGKNYESTDWPLPEVKYQQFYLNAATKQLTEDSQTEQASASYDSLSEKGEVIFELRFKTSVNIVGHASLKLFVSADNADDMDLFVSLEKLDSKGEPVYFPHYAIYREGPVALGWLRVSHRELDHEKSTEFLPVLRHRQEQKLQAGEIVETNIEILPSGTHFEPDESLRLRIKGRDIYNFQKPLLYSRHEDSVNKGNHNIWTGGKTASCLTLPVLISTDENNR